MNSSQRKLAAILKAMGVPPSARRSTATPATPACESLEGRQLLAGGLGFGGMTQGPGMGASADISTATTGSGLNDNSASSGATAMPGQRFGGMHHNSFGRMAMQGPGMGGQVNASATSTTTGTPSGFGGGRFDQLGGSGDPGSMAPTADTTQLHTDQAKFRTDAQAIHDKSQVTPAMEAKVRLDIQTIKGAETTTPDPAALTTLKTDRQAARANVGGPTDAEIAQIQTDQDAVYKSEGVNAALTTLLDTDQAAIKTASGVTAADQTTLAADRAAIQADLAKLKPAVTTTTTTSTSTDPSSSTTTTTPPTDTPTMTPNSSWRHWRGGMGGMPMNRG